MRSVTHSRGALADTGAARTITASLAHNANRLLAGMPPSEWEHLQPELDWVELPLGVTLHAAGDVLRHAYFPVTGIVSLVSTLSDGASSELAMVGSEGLVGVCAFVGGDRTHSSAIVQSAGYGWRIAAATLAAHTRRSAATMQPLLRYAQALSTQMAQTSNCNCHHSLDQRLCRWLLLNLDRHKSRDVITTHQRIATLLGVRREGITGSALKLQKAGLIRYGRGHVSILDRAGLEAYSCECYSVIRQAYDRLLEAPPGQRTMAASPPAPRMRSAA
jgi:CRP-like cAMP-binding protein